MRSIHDNLQAVRERIARAALAAGRDPLTVALLAVSKTHAASLVARIRRGGNERARVIAATVSVGRGGATSREERLKKP